MKVVAVKQIFLTEVMKYRYFGAVFFPVACPVPGNTSGRPERCLWTMTDRFFCLLVNQPSEMRRSRLALELLREKNKARSSPNQIPPNRVHSTSTILFDVDQVINLPVRADSRHLRNWVRSATASIHHTNRCIARQSVSPALRKPSAPNIDAIQAKSCCSESRCAIAPSTTPP
jgi:hypothetical protein